MQRLLSEADSHDADEVVAPTENTQPLEPQPESQLDVDGAETAVDAVGKETDTDQKTGDESFPEPSATSAPSVLSAATSVPQRSRRHSAPPCLCVEPYPPRFRLRGEDPVDARLRHNRLFLSFLSVSIRLKLQRVAVHRLEQDLSQEGIVVRDFATQPWRRRSVSRTYNSTFMEPDGTMIDGTVNASDGRVMESDEAVIQSLRRRLTQVGDGTNDNSRSLEDNVESKAAADAPRRSLCGFWWPWFRRRLP